MQSSKRYLFYPKSRLKDFPTEIKHLYKDESDLESSLLHLREVMSARQDLLFASRERGVLAIFQGMDTSGKDGVIKHVMSGLNPLGVEVSAFSAPSVEEKHRDFLWRTHLKVPPRGKIGIFNRSYYEEVLTVRVHPNLLADERLPVAADPGKKFWKHRLEDIVNFEEYLERQGFTVIKFFLNLSHEEQGNRLRARIDTPEKNWKFDPGDLEDRAKWKEFMKAYEELMKETSRAGAPWYIIPADDKKTARLLVSMIFAETLQAMDLSEPHVSEGQRRRLKALRKKI